MRWEDGRDHNRSLICLHRAWKNLRRRLSDSPQDQACLLNRLSCVASLGALAACAVVLAIVVMGGMGSQLGVAIAAFAMIGGTEILRELDWLKRVFGADFEPTQYRMLLFGLAMVLLMIWKPRGLISFRAPSIFLRERRLVRADMVKEGHG